MTLRLAYSPPYSWHDTLAFLARRAVLGVEAVSGDTYLRSIALGGEQGFVSVRPGRGNGLKVSVHFPAPSALPGIVVRLRRVFDLEADASIINAHLARDPRLALLVEARPGLRVPGAWGGFELAVRAIVGQQITVTAAVGLLGKLTRQFGVSLAGAASRGHPSITHAFPEARDLVDADIAAVGMPRARANAIRGLARTVVVRPAVLSPRRNLDEAIEALKELPGIGEWTAQYIAMRELREPDAFPAGDVGLLRAMEAGPGVRPTPRELLTLAEKWRPWRAYAAAHLWASLSTPGLRPWQPRAKHSAA